MITIDIDKYNMCVYVHVYMYMYISITQDGV